MTAFSLMHMFLQVYDPRIPISVWPMRGDRYKFGIGNSFPSCASGEQHYKQISIRYAGCTEAAAP